MFHHIRKKIRDKNDTFSSDRFSRSKEMKGMKYVKQKDERAGHLLCRLLFIFIYHIIRHDIYYCAAYLLLCSSLLFLDGEGN